MRTNQAAIETKTKYDNKKNKKGEGSVVKKKKKKKKNKRRERTGSTVESMMNLSQETSEYSQKKTREEVLLFVW